MTTGELQARPGQDFLVLGGVSKRYGSVVGLDSASFTVRRGEIFGYIGPNGAGKTTTIKVIVGLIRNFEGEVSLDGHPIADGGGLTQRRVGYLPQDTAFQSWRTVDQALDTFGRLSGMSQQQVRERIPQVLQRFGILETRYRKITQLSGGTAQKVGLAQATLHDPDLLVLDEPMAGLDPASRFQFKEILRQYREQGKTVFFSSHILSDVQDIADRIGILNFGRILHVGTISELRSRLSVPKDIVIRVVDESVLAAKPFELAGLTSLERVEPGVWVAHLRPDSDLDAMVDSMIDSLRKAGCKIRSIYPAEPDLEQLYVQFVGAPGR